MFDIFADPATWISLLALTAMEIVLGIDNLIFMAIIAGRLPPDQAKRAQYIGLGLALGFRVVLLFALAWIISLTQPVFTLFGRGFSWRDLILIGGGLFLLFKATSEMHEQIEGDHAVASAAAAKPTDTLTSAVVQIAIINLVFSIDSIVTAIGLSTQILVMVLAIVISMAVMVVSVGPIGRFVERHPTIKVLALSFLMLIGATLVADGAGFHFPHGYVYFAMAFAATVEVVNMLIRRRKGAKAHATPPAPAE